MDRTSSPRSTDKKGFLSCWGCFKLKLPWAQRRGKSTNTRMRVSKLGGGFNYDPLSYAQNFDEGCDDDDEESSHRGFSARYAAPSSKSLGDK
jgi:hypothetical protein